MNLFKESKAYKVLWDQFMIFFYFYIHPSLKFNFWLLNRVIYAWSLALDVNCYLEFGEDQRWAVDIRTKEMLILTTPKLKTTSHLFVLFCIYLLFLHYIFFSWKLANLLPLFSAYSVFVNLILSPCWYMLIWGNILSCMFTDFGSSFTWADDELSIFWFTVSPSEMETGNILLL